MEFRFSPWRYAYVAGEQRKTGCVFCDAPRSGDDAKVNIIHRGKDNYIILNAYPYNSGHVMIVPFAHLDQLAKLPPGTASEMIALSQQMERILREEYKPNGLNLGMNIGDSAGAGVAGHVHLHVLPRWTADSNFITTVAETRVLPEALDDTYRRLKKHW
jgi:ATP adenylyltransferase